MNVTWLEAPTKPYTTAIKMLVLTDDVKWIFIKTHSADVLHSVMCECQEEEKTCTTLILLPFFLFETYLRNLLPREKTEVALLYPKKSITWFPLVISYVYYCTFEVFKESLEYKLFFSAFFSLLSLISFSTLLFNACGFHLNIFSLPNSWHAHVKILCTKQNCIDCEINFPNSFPIWPEGKNIRLFLLWPVLYEFPSFPHTSFS